MGVLFDDWNYGVDTNEDGEGTGEDGLNGDENNAGDGLRRFGDAEFFDKDEDTYDGENANRLNKHVDDVCWFSLERTTPKEETKH